MGSAVMPTKPCACRLLGLSSYMIVNRGYIYRIYPTEEQEQLLIQFIGSYRFAWNWALARWNSDYIDTGKADMYVIKKDFTALKKTEPFTWLQKMPCTLTDSILNLGNAWTRYLKKVKGAERPVFKKKRIAESCPVNSKVLVDSKNGRIFLGGSKLDIKARIHRTVPGEIKSSIIKRNAAGQWFIIFKVAFDEVQSSAGKQLQPSIGYDLGLKDLLALSDGTKIDAPKFYKKAEKKLAKLQRRHAKKQKGSNNREKARQKVAKLHVHVANQRKDLAHQISNRLASENQAVACEDLSINGMGRGLKNMRKAVHDAGFGQITGLMAYKCAREGTAFVKVKRFVRSTGVCPNTLQNRAVKLLLSDRNWTCSCCGIKWDRDIAAAKVIEQLGRDAAKVKPVETGTSTFSIKSIAQARSKKQEAVYAEVEHD